MYVIKTFATLHTKIITGLLLKHNDDRYYDDDPYDRRSMHRTLSQPSLARSASEFTERWIVPQPDEEEHTSPEVTPRPVRSVRVMVNIQYIHLYTILCAFAIIRADRHNIYSYELMPRFFSHILLTCPERSTAATINATLDRCVSGRRSIGRRQ